MEGTSRRALAAAAAALALGAVPAGAAGAVVVGQGIAGVSLGMSQARVRAVHGRPGRVLRDVTELGASTEYRYAGLSVLFLGNARVTSVATTRRSERTAGGAGVGSTAARVRAVVPGARCRGPAAARVCEVGDPSRPGARVTAFTLTGPRVTGVSVYVVSG